MVDFKLKEAFVCHQCQTKCGFCVPDLEKIERSEEPEDKELFPRKQLIDCLGPYCDKPCEYQKETSDLSLEKCINLIMWLGNKCNNLIDEKYKLKNKK